MARDRYGNHLALKDVVKCSYRIVAIDDGNGTVTLKPIDHQFVTIPGGVNVTVPASTVVAESGPVDQGNLG